ncbi:hypothetical protein ACL72_10130 [Listeria monocytogenes]|uniref:Uncharacterized protein n=1 Tax=Listeria immobilis TaxID=2713502 RepID=A0ABR6SYS0_9LIST|nr:hypothetical protein [Listeria immobilis]EAC4628511.1 hypothetical protein [Listeria monocytogenes]EAC6356364.1 hypothetical protein [Listeria monocytogenes]EAC7062893.1 hypothetical protein [Listeria monocytogenes]EAD7040796.1 hypothetical protein [Listeria monocytogenes]MBC1507383.1 hypothetical protein [Listeria immobilis]
MKIYEAMMNKVNQHNARILANKSGAIEAYNAFRSVIIPLLAEANDFTENETEKTAIKLIREMLFITHFNADARAEYEAGKMHSFFINNIMFYDSFEGNESQIELYVSDCDKDRSLRIAFSKTIRYCSSDINREYGKIKESVKEVLENNELERVNNIDLINNFNIHRDEF